MSEITDNNIFCTICYNNIDNEFSILNCNCKSSVYHTSCINQWYLHYKRCPTCNHKFNDKPSKILKNISSKIYNIFAINYNMLRFMIGMNGLRYSS